MKTEAKTFEPHSVDCDGFFELRATRLDVEAALGPDDLRHPQRLETVGALYTPSVVVALLALETAFAPEERSARVARTAHGLYFFSLPHGHPSVRFTFGSATKSTRGVSNIELPGDDDKPRSWVLASRS